MGERVTQQNSFYAFENCKHMIMMMVHPGFIAVHRSTSAVGSHSQQLWALRILVILDHDAPSLNKLWFYTLSSIDYAFLIVDIYDIFCIFLDKVSSIVTVKQILKLFYSRLQTQSMVLIILIWISKPVVTYWKEGLETNCTQPLFAKRLTNHFRYEYLCIVFANVC